MSIVAAVVDLHRALDGAGVAHAFGGALALAYYAEPRATADIDVNVFVDEPGRDLVVDALAALGYEGDVGPGDPPIAGVRFTRSSDPFPVDVFLPLDAAYDEIASRVVRWPFGPAGVELPFLSAEDLVVFKLSFGRDRDWVDLRRLVQQGPALDVEYVERQLVHLRGPAMYPRVVRLRSFLPA